MSLNEHIGATPTGSITIEINNGDNPANYNITWFEDLAMTTPLGIGIVTGINGVRQQINLLAEVIQLS